MALRGRNPVGYGWEMWEWQLLVGEIYIIYYIYVGDINILYKISRINPPRKIHHVLETCHGASLRRVCIVGLCWRRATARLYVGYETIGIYCCLLSIVRCLLFVVLQKKYPLKINDIQLISQHPPFCVATPGC